VIAMVALASLRVVISVGDSSRIVGSCTTAALKTTSSSFWMDLLIAGVVGGLFDAPL